MTDELNLEALDADLEKENQEHVIDKRIKNLSEKVRLTAEERDEQKHLLEEKISANENLKKENSFLNSFGDTLGKYPEASSYKDKI